MEVIDFSGVNLLNFFVDNFVQLKVERLCLDLTISVPMRLSVATLGVVLDPNGPGMSEYRFRPVGFRFARR